MPIYEFYCFKCDKVVEEILPVGYNEKDCKVCGTKMEKKMSSFMGIVPGSTNRTLDSIVGADAERRWKKVINRKDQRIKSNKE